MSCCKLCNNLKILRCFDFGDGIYPVYRIYPEKGIQPVRYHNEEAYGCSIYGGMRKIRTYETLFTFTVQQTVAITTLPAYLKWQELKDSNPYKMIWNHLCYHYTKFLEMAGKARLELATHRLTVCRSNRLNYIPVLFTIILYIKSYVKHLKCDLDHRFQLSHSKYFRNTLGIPGIKPNLSINDDVLTNNTKFSECF